MPTLAQQISTAYGAIVKSITPKAALSILCCSVILGGASAPSFAQVAKLHFSAPPTGAAAAAGAAAASTGLGQGGAISPIKESGIGVVSPSVPFFSVVPAPLSVLPAAAGGPAAPQGSEEAPPTDPLGAAQDMVQALAVGGDAAKGGDKAAGSLRKAFDGSIAGGTGDGGDGVPGGESAASGAPLGRLYPRVVMILDTLDRPAAEGGKLVKYIETLVDKGVRVVFVTARAEKGENSAAEVLISKLKVRTGNPVIVVSYNGARAAAHNSKAENPKPLIADQPAFAEKTLERFREITAAVKAKLGARGKIVEFGQPSLEAPYIYGAELPSGVDASAWAAAFNRALKSAGFAYKVELSKNAEGRTIFLTQSTALKLNAGRVFNALYAAAPELDPAKGGHSVLNPSQVLVLADPTKAPSFLQALPGKGYYIHGVNDAASLERALEAVLGGSALEQVSVNKYDLREYIDWLERRQRYGAATRASGAGSGGASARNPNSTGWHRTAFFRGIVMKETMSRVYHLLKNGAYEEASLDSALAILEKLWRYPEANGMHLPEELKLGRQTAGFKAAQKGGLEVAKRWLKNYYHRHFPDFPRGVNEKVVGRLLRLARDGDSVTIQYASPYTGRGYKVFVRPDRTELWEDDRGYILVGHVYRTGKEPFQNQFDESIEVNLVGRALLEGDAQKRADGRWYVNGEPDPRVMVIFHYNTRDLETAPMTPAEVESHTPEVTTLIEKRAADTAYQKWIEDKKKEEERARINLKRTVTREANAAAKAKAKAASKEKPS